MRVPRRVCDAVSEDVLRRKVERQQNQIEQLEAMIEDRSRDIFQANEELRVANERLLASLEETHSMQRALVDASRKAGMADVATSVLHNVGNVLNSVNVSSSVVAGIARSSRGAGLGRAVALLRSQPDPGHFLTHDPRGKKLIDYLEGVAGALDGERAKTVDELGALERNIEHIKVIVSMQQSHARVTDTVERVSLRSLVDDAIRIHAASYERHTIDVTKELCEVDELVTDRHKLFQILMNFLTNAGQALKGREEGRRLVVRTLREGPNLVSLEVEDNGIGIPQENLTKIFAHGFTTKAEGHGFGLHSSANTAAEMGGRIEARSDGPGCGAVFKLVLPEVMSCVSVAPRSRRVA